MYPEAVQSGMYLQDQSPYSPLSYAQALHVASYIHFRQNYINMASIKQNCY